ncbi:hypothetical protein [Ornithinibacillus contaminans]|uniref:hypothetical protein n=1 Tax=Ornithinibacillus contaminans TaxID=694055 RepID=UPI00064DE3CC|nr:hypothetical protein [Ornithinibacillus contaminans]
MSTRKIEPIATFEWKIAQSLIAMFPSIQGGSELVLCAKAKDGSVLVQHTCMVCEMYGHKNCPYVKNALFFYMLYKKQRFERYKIAPERVVLKKEWEQIPIPSKQSVTN